MVLLVFQSRVGCFVASKAPWVGSTPAILQNPFGPIAGYDRVRNLWTCRPAFWRRLAVYGSGSCYVCFSPWFDLRSEYWCCVKNLEFGKFPRKRKPESEKFCKKWFQRGWTVELLNTLTWSMNFIIWTDCCDGTVVQHFYILLMDKDLQIGSTQEAFARWFDLFVPKDFHFHRIFIDF